MLSLRAISLTLTMLLAASLSMAVPAARGGKSPQSTAAKHSTRSTHARRTRRHSRRQRGQRAPTADRISEIQTALAKDGSFPGTPNGKWDASTVAAMKRFQDAHGLNPTGKLDALTLQKLGLGSQTTGVAPPLPPTTSTSVSTGPLPIARR
ncbi:MAG TPA: peptidoglycan-binding domain-containing protein [Candidatus Acidoferrum sp.]|nr:peptidoglycan-binding domain-containing protein [Candidatus Acidoferrum sp.]